MTQAASAASADAGSAVSPIGLAAAAARARLAEVGPNELAPPARRPVPRILIAQLTSPLILLLLGGAAVAAIVGHWLDASAIALIVSINAVVGFVQEYRAERAVMALRSMTARRARVVRDGVAQIIVATQVVPGDLLLLDPGGIVAADAELIEAHNLSVSEAVLTGESLPAHKAVEPTSAGAPLAERTGQVFLGTSVATGTGKARVTATGRSTQMGKIASVLAEQSLTSTPLQERLAGLGRIIAVACVVLVGIVAVAILLRGFGWLDVLLTSVSLAVAAVPEGLPTVVTIALAVGVHRMAARHVLVRRLASVETLGSATVICTDKTGTLTTGMMEVREVWGPDRRVVLEAAASASDADLEADGEGTGDATELAILRAARAAGVERAALESANPRVHVEPFDATTRRMSIERADGTTFLKGAVEAVVEACEGPLGVVREAAETLASRGLRVIAVASGRGGRMTVVGLVGLADPPRPEALDAIAQAKRAGVRIVMITGDHQKTADAIAREMGLVDADGSTDGVVFARTTPTDKLQIVRDLRARGEVVAMTGDGVNDAPSIKEADIGVAMGRTATEVTREAADMILTEDNLSGIVHAIREGRVIYANIRKTVVYLLGGNSAELVVMIVAAAAGLPLPLLPLQLLWINLLGEPLPGIALSIDPPATDVLDVPPRPRNEPLMGGRQWLEVGAVAVLQGAVVLAAFVWALGTVNLATARTLAFSALVFGVIFRALAGRSATRILWEIGWTTNLRLVAVVAVSAAMQVAIVYYPGSQRLFGLAELSVPLLVLALGLGLIPVTVVELTKLVLRGAQRGRERVRQLS